MPEAGITKKAGGRPRITEAATHNQMHQIANPPPAQAENRTNGNGQRGPLVHLGRGRGHTVACGLDTHYHHETVISRAVGEVTCQRCLRSHRTLTALRHKARRWDRLSGQRPKSTYEPRPLVNVGIALDRARAARA